VKWSDKHSKLVRRTVSMSHSDIHEFLVFKKIVPQHMRIDYVDYDTDEHQLTVELKEETPIVEDAKP